MVFFVKQRCWNHLDNGNLSYCNLQNVMFSLLFFLILKIKFTQVPLKCHVDFLRITFLSLKRKKLSWFKIETICHAKISIHSTKILIEPFLSFFWCNFWKSKRNATHNHCFIMTTVNCPMTPLYQMAGLVDKNK